MTWFRLQRSYLIDWTICNKSDRVGKKGVILYMLYGYVREICIGPKAQAPMISVPEAWAIARKGLRGDRYEKGEGSFNRNKDTWHGQVTLMSSHFIEGSGFEFIQTRRNILVEGVELMRCINKKFSIGGVVLFGYKYCEPCQVPSKLIGSSARFDEVFFEKGGLIAEILVGGPFKVGDIFLPPPKNY